MSKKPLSCNYVTLYSFREYNGIVFPKFQRGYDWGEDQINAFIKDVEEDLENKYEIGEENHFMQDIVAFVDDDNNLCVADGQQRITTYCIAVKVFNEIISARKLNVKKIDYVKLRHELPQFNESLQAFFANETRKKSFKAYADAEKLIREFLLEKVDMFDFIYTLLTSDLAVYLKIAPGYGAAYEMFCELNSGGKPLTIGECELSSLSYFSEQYKLPLAPIINKNNVNDFVIRYYKKLHLEDYAKTLNKAKTVMFVEEEITNSREALVAFYEFASKAELFDNYAVVQVSNLCGRKQFLDIVHALLYAGYDLNNPRVTKFVLELICFCLINSLRSNNPGGVSRFILECVVRDINKGLTIEETRENFRKQVVKYPELFFMKRGEFNSSLHKDKGKYNFQKAFKFIEFLEKNQNMVVNFNDLEIEHVYPQNPDKDAWYRHGYDFTGDKKNKYVYNMGNLIILDKKNNSAASNKYITDKMASYERCYSGCSALDYPLNHPDFTLFDDNPKYINDRCNEVMSYICSKMEATRLFLRP